MSASAPFIIELLAASALPAIAPGHWYEVPNSKLRAVVPSPPVVGGNVVNIMAWSGAAFDPVTSSLYVWGGGHENYAGNELYSFSLQTLKWRRVTEPSIPDRTGGGDVYLSDGQPRSRHTYNYIEWVDGRLLSMGGVSMYPNGGSGVGGTRRIAEFSPATNKWVTGLRAPVPVSGGNMIGAHARLDPQSGDIFMLPAQTARLMRYTPSTNTWKTGWGQSYVRVHSTLAIDPQRRWAVLLGSGTEMAQCTRFSLDTRSVPVDLRPITGGAEAFIERAYGPGFDFHPPSGNFYAWAGGKSVYVLDPDTWRWTMHTAPATSPDPGSQHSRGTYGRWRYVPALNLFVVVNSIDRNVWVYRP